MGRVLRAAGGASNAPQGRIRFQGQPAQRAPRNAAPRASDGRLSDGARAWFCAKCRRGRKRDANMRRLDCFETPAQRRAGVPRQPFAFRACACEGRRGERDGCVS